MYSPFLFKTCLLSDNIEMFIDENIKPFINPNHHILNHNFNHLPHHPPHHAPHHLHQGHFNQNNFINKAFDMVDDYIFGLCNDTEEDKHIKNKMDELVEENVKGLSTDVSHDTTIVPNPTGTSGTITSAGTLNVGNNFVGQRFRTELRSEPINPTYMVSPWLNSSYTPDFLENNDEIADVRIKMDELSDACINENELNDNILIEIKVPDINEEMNKAIMNCNVPQVRMLLTNFYFENVNDLIKMAIKLRRTEAHNNLEKWKNYSMIIDLLKSKKN